MFDNQIVTPPHCSCGQLQATVGEGKREFYFADCRLVADEALCRTELIQNLTPFTNKIPFTYSVSLNIGNRNLLDSEYAEALQSPLVFQGEAYDVRKSDDGWMFDSSAQRLIDSPETKFLVKCSEDYKGMTIYAAGENDCYSPFRAMTGLIYKVGAVFEGGCSIHASLVEKDGYGVMFVGRSGIGKSTQAGLWKKYLGAEIINGDSPMLFRNGDSWFGSGLPWDGKDRVHIQRSLPVKAIVDLEQSGENSIERLDSQQALSALLPLLMYPLWDERAMDALTELISDIVARVPFYHLKNLADRDAAVLTLRTINEMEG